MGLEYTQNQAHKLSVAVERLKKENKKLKESIERLEKECTCPKSDIGGMFYQECEHYNSETCECESDYR